MKHKQSITGSIYEVCIQSHCDEGTFFSLQKDLKRIVSMGFDWILLNPFQPYEEDIFQVTSYIGVDQRLGTIDDFIKFLDYAHGLNLKVMMKFELQHCSVNHEWSHLFPYYFDQRHDLNYANSAMREKLFSALLYWTKLGIDGYVLLHDTFVLESYLDFLERSIHKYKKLFVVIRESQESLNSLESYGKKRLITTYHHHQNRLRNHIVLQFLKPSIPIICAGQETLTDLPLSNLNPIAWTKIDQDTVDLFQQLNAIRHKQVIPNVYVETDTVIHMHYDFVDVICANGNSEEVHVEIEDGKYLDLFSKQMISVHDGKIASKKLPICLQKEKL